MNYLIKRFQSVLFTVFTINIQTSYVLTMLVLNFDYTLLYYHLMWLNRSKMSGKQCRPRSDAAYDIGLHLFTQACCPNTQEKYAIGDLSLTCAAVSENMPSDMCAREDSSQPITKTRLFKCIENFTTKIWKFSDKNSDISHISAKNIGSGYSLELPHRGSSNKYPQSMFLSRNKKNNVYPINPSFII